MWGYYQRDKPSLLDHVTIDVDESFHFKDQSKNAEAVVDKLICTCFLVLFLYAWVTVLSIAARGKGSAFTGCKNLLDEISSCR